MAKNKTSTQIKAKKQAAAGYAESLYKMCQSTPSETLYEVRHKETGIPQGSLVTMKEFVRDYYQTIAEWDLVPAQIGEFQ